MMQRFLFKSCFSFFLVGFLTFVLPGTSRVEESPLKQAEEAFRTGLYEDALGLYEGLRGADRIAGVVGASRTFVMIGDYQKAEEVCRKALGAFPGDERITVQLAEVLALTGRSDQALQVLEPVSQGPMPTIRSLVQYGKLLRLRGRKTEANAYFEQALSFYERGLVFDAEDMAMTGFAFWALERFHDANNVFREAVRTDPANLEAQVVWGDLFLEKYNEAEARRSYAEVLKQNDRYVPALVGMAKMVGGQAANRFLEAALEINKRSVPALETKAALFIEDDRYDAAETTLKQALEINPESLNAMTLLAAIAYLKEDETAFQKLSNQVEAFSPGNGAFYARIAEICSRRYRFEEAVKMARQAIAIDPRQWNGYTVLGISLLRLGREEEGRARLEQGFQKDPFNFWAMNMLRVLDVLDGFETRQTDHFTVRMHPSDAKVLWPYLEPLLLESWNTLTAKYDFTPQGPILVEVFPDHEDFAVRTFGLPDIGHFLGVCFGHVITLDSPRALKSRGPINWQEIVWHEFAHVITLQMTQNKIPRWLSEGISVFEEKHGRPEWGRRQDLELVKAFQEDRILGLRQLDESFSKAKTAEDLNFAYYESFLWVEHIVERYGFEALKAFIYQFATFKDIGDISYDVFQISLENFEEGFRSWIKDRVKKINVYVQRADASGVATRYGSGPGDRPSTESSQRGPLTEAMRKRIEEQPRDFQAQFQLGLTLYESKNFEEAIKHLAIARDLLPEYASSPNPRQVLAAIYEAMGDKKAMIRELEGLVKIQQHAFAACYKLGQAAHEQKDFNRTVYYLERAIAVDPYNVDVHRLLGAVAMEHADYETAVREYSVLLALDDRDPALANTDLAEALLRRGNKAEAKAYALSALEIAPTYERAQDILLDSLEP